MRRRDRQNEIVVALIVTVAMAFALALSILLSLGRQDDDRNDTASATPFATLPTQTVGVLPTETATNETITAVFTETEVVSTEEPPIPPVTQEIAELPTQIEAIETAAVTEETATNESIALTTAEAPSPAPSDAPEVTATRQPTSTSTLTPEPTATDTEQPSATATPSHTNTPRPTRTFTPTPTNTPSPTYTNTATRTPRPTATDTITPSPTRTLTPTRTLSRTPSFTPSSTFTLTPAPTYTTIMLMLPSPTACVMVDNWDSYTVQRGDTLFSIARQADVSVSELAEANCISNTALIFAGQTLFVPPGSLSNIPLNAGGTANPADAGVVQCSSANAQITAPSPGAQLNGTVTLYGTAGGANFGRYVLGWRPDITGEIFRVFEERYQPTSTTLGQINTDLLPAGLYWFSLTVLNQQGEITGECAIRVRFQ